MDIVVDVGNSEVTEKVVSKFGNGAHVFVSKENIGESVKIVFGKCKILKGKLVVDFLGSEIIERVVKGIGTGAHVIVPREYIGKEIKLVIGL
ncbi:DUF2080 family transposase-associated protein [archaeon]|jgi:putative transposon-encoded protein|nr:DUF2080 family transposase-associated protein [archaeon]MBT7128134.1 DUF2080 family transposase-associated protein [archaeon]